MATYMIAFRLAWGDNYTDRWASVVAAIRRQAIGPTWEELTALIILQSDNSADEVASAIYVTSALDITKDTLLVVDVDGGGYAIRGKIEDPATLSLLLSRGTLFNALRGFGT